MKGLILTAALAAFGAVTPAFAQIPETVDTAIRAGDVATLADALAAGADPNARQDEGLNATVLMLAASNPDPAMVDLLLAAGAEVNTPDLMGDPAINWAAYYGHDRVVARLLDAGADIDLVGHGNALQIVMRRGHDAAIAELLDHTGQLPDRSARERALEAALMAGDVAAIERLVVGMDLAGARDWAGRPVLQAAARADRAESLAALIAAGADVDATDAIGFTALFEAARDGQASAVAALIELGADVSHVSDDTSLSLTPVHLAAIGGNPACVEALLAAGADPDVYGKTGATPLLWAAFEGQRESVRALIEGGADPFLATPDGTTVRDAAEFFEWADIAALIDARAPD